MAGTRSRKGVRFQHKANGSDGRRSSFSDASEDGSAREHRSQLEPVQEVRYTAPSVYTQSPPPPRCSRDGDRHAEAKD